MRWWRLTIFFVLVAALLSLSMSVLDWRMTQWSITTVGDFFSPFLAPDFSLDFLQRVANGALETLAMAAIATLISAVLAALLAFAADSGNRFFYFVLFNGLRTIPELLFASILVLVVGLGSTAGVLALTLHTTGVLGRLFASALQNSERDHGNALRLAGASAWTVFLFGFFPTVKTQWLSYTLYRSEMNIRAAAVLGLVGAGGLGQQLYFSLSLFQYHKAATLILATIVLVIAAETLSRYLRRNRFSNAQVD